MSDGLNRIADETTAKIAAALFGTMAKRVVTYGFANTEIQDPEAMPCFVLRQPIDNFTEEVQKNVLDAMQKAVEQEENKTQMKMVVACPEQNMIDGTDPWHRLERFCSASRQERHDLKRELGEVKEDLQDSEHACEAWHKNVIELTPFELPSRHHAVELLHEWRKRWDGQERKITDLELQLATASRVEGVDGTMPRPEMPTFQELEQPLVDWKDADEAAFQVGVVLGLWSSDREAWRENKHVFWTNNDLGNAIHATLKHLVGRGILERRDEPDLQYRWKGA